MSIPFYSVVITTHNSAATIEKTICSVIEQSFNDYEIIVIDDASVDNTVTVINQLIKKFEVCIRFYQNSVNKGVSFTRNRGIDKSKGQYITFLDGDDVWLKDKLKKEAQFLKESHIDWVCSNYNVINEKYEYINKRIRKPGIYTYKDIVKSGNPIGMLTVAISKKILLNNKFRNIHHEDFDLWIRLARKGYICFTINDVLASYMKSKTSLSGNKLKSILWTYNVFRKNDLSFCISVVLTIKYLLNVINRKKR